MEPRNELHVFLPPLSLYLVVAHQHLSVILTPDLTGRVQVGTVEEYMFKEGVRDILDKLDYDLVGLIPVKRRVREIAALLVLDKASPGYCCTQFSM